MHVCVCFLEKWWLCFYMLGSGVIEALDFHRIHNAVNVLGNVFMVSSCFVEYIKLNTWVWTDITSALVAQIQSFPP